VALLCLHVAPSLANSDSRNLVSPCRTPASRGAWSGVIRENLATRLRDAMTTVRKIGASAIMGSALALGACMASIGTSPVQAHLTAGANVLGNTARDVADRPGSDTTQPFMEGYGDRTISSATCSSPTCDFIPASMAVGVGSLNAQSSPTGHLVARWSRRLQEPTVISDGLVLYGCGAGCVAADYVRSGTRSWAFVDHENSEIWGLAAADGVVLVAAGRLQPNSCGQCLQFAQVYRVDALDETTGRLLWMLPISPGRTDGPIQWLPAVIADQVAVVQLTNGLTLGVGLRTGKVLWRSGRPASYCYPQPPAGAVPEVVLVGCSGQVEALDPVTGRVLWTAAISTALGSAGGAVEVATDAASGVVAIELGFGTVPGDVPSLESAFEKENSPWDMTSILMVSASTGASRWSLIDVAQEPVVFGGNGSLCVQAFAGVECRSASTGRLRWSLGTPYVPAGTFVQLWNPIAASGGVAYVIKPGAGTTVTRRAWFLESLSVSSGTKFVGDTLLPKVPPDPYGTPTPPSVAAIGDGIVLVLVGTGGQQMAVAYGPQA
jgi:outer membrane protein assembly factor BamB